MMFSRSEGMTVLEELCIIAMNQTYDSIYPCCQVSDFTSDCTTAALTILCVVLQASKDCDEQLLNSSSSLVSSVRDQFDTLQNITQVLNTNF